MRKTKIIMGMPVVVDLPHEQSAELLDEIFEYFRKVDNRYSPYKVDSEVSRFNDGVLPEQLSKEFRTIMELCEQTKQDTNGYFDAWHNDTYDPSGLVKGWAVHKAAQLVREAGVDDYYLEAGGDIQLGGHNAKGDKWQIGIRNPFDRTENVKVVNLSNRGIATSGTDVRGQHVYNPHEPSASITDIMSITVIGPNIYEADRYATAAFAMGEPGLTFIENISGLEAYMIKSNRTAIATSGFDRYEVHP